MSPSGSRMQTEGTSIAARFFWRRASRRSASGRKIEGDSGFLLSSRGGMVLSGERAFEDHPVMIGWQFDKFRELEFADFNGSDRLLGRHPQSRPWTARFTQDRSFLAWSLMP